MISNNVSFPIIKNIVAKVSVTLEQNILVSQMSFFLNFFSGNYKYVYSYFTNVKYVSKK